MSSPGRRHRSRPLNPIVDVGHLFVAFPDTTFDRKALGHGLWEALGMIAIPRNAKGL